MTAPRRRWSFGLRTMLLVVLAVCVCLGWQVHSVRTRWAILIAVKQRGGHFFAQRTILKMQPLSLTRLPAPSVPIWREWLGDFGVGVIRIADDDERSNSDVQKWFPEAYVYRYSEIYDESGNRRTP